MDSFLLLRPASSRAPFGRSGVALHGLVITANYGPLYSCVLAEPLYWKCKGTGLKLSIIDGSLVHANAQVGGKADDHLSYPLSHVSPKFRKGWPPVRTFTILA